MAANSEQLLKWSGLVESKIRILIGQLENNEAFQSVHVYPRSYDAPPTMDDDKDGEGSSVGNIWFIGLDLKKSGEISITGEAQLFVNAGQSQSVSFQSCYIYMIWYQSF
jgi:poly(A) polymerase Pap1